LVEATKEILPLDKLHSPIQSGNSYVRSFLPLHRQKEKSLCSCEDREQKGSQTGTKVVCQSRNIDFQKNTVAAASTAEEDLRR